MEIDPLFSIWMIGVGGGAALGYFSAYLVCRLSNHVRYLHNELERLRNQ